MEKLSIGIVGGKGMLGSDLVKFLGEKYITTAIDVDSYESHKGESFDVIVNANGNSRRFWANENPLEDFVASTMSVYKTLIDFKFKKYIYISSSDVYEDHTNPATASEDVVVSSDRLAPYGFHKSLSERIVRERAEDWLILRASMMMGSNLRKGPFFDLAQGSPLFITKDSRLQFITTEAVARVIEMLVGGGVTKEVFNMGGEGAFVFGDVEKYIKRPIVISEKAERQEYEMSVAKLKKLYPLKKSEEYLQEFLNGYNALK